MRPCGNDEFPLFDDLGRNQPIRNILDGFVLPSQYYDFQ